MTLVGYSLPLRLFQRRFCSRIAHHRIPQAVKKPADRHGSNKSSPAVWPNFPLDAPCPASGYSSASHYINRKAEIFAQLGGKMPGRRWARQAFGMSGKIRGVAVKHQIKLMPLYAIHLGKKADRAAVMQLIRYK
jgi:hypothetical protein